MGIASKMAKINMSMPSVNSKTQKEKAEKKVVVNYIACANCHQDNITLIKCTDSYYCKKCMIKLGKQKFNKKK